MEYHVLGCQEPPGTGGEVVLGGAASTLLDAVDQASGDGVRDARVARVRALLAQAAGDHAAAERYLRTSVDAYRTAGPCRELARAALNLSDLLGERGRSAEAIELLHATLTDVEALTGRG